MPYTPIFSAEYQAKLLGLWYSLSGALDLNEGSPDVQLASALGSMFEVLDARLGALVQSHGLKARGADLDDVVAQIMAARAIIRGGATRAAAPAMQFTRDTATGALPVPAGGQVKSSTDTSLVYTTDEAFTFLDGQTIYPGVNDAAVHVTCATPGYRGNAQAGTVTVLVPGSFPTSVYQAVNTVAITGGEDVEGDSSLAQRAQLLLASIAKSQPGAVRGLASRFVGSDGTVIRHAALFEPASMPAYSELVISDGFGLPNLTRPALTRSGTAGPNGVRLITFDFPAATEPKIKKDGGPWRLPSEYPGLNVIHERGEIEFTDGAVWPSGTTWETGAHRVFTGVVEEIQALIEGSPDAVDVANYGWRSSGCRIRVRPPLLQYVSFNLRAEFVGVSNAVGRVLLSDALTGYVASLGIGKRLNLFRLSDEAAKLPEVDDFEVLTPSINMQPDTQRHQFVTDPSRITYV
jgi:hypothetical protein